MHDLDIKEVLDRQRTSAQCLSSIEAEKRLKEFQAAVSEYATTVTMRIEKGTSSASACGQLRLHRRMKEEI